MASRNRHRSRVVGAATALCLGLAVAARADLPSLFLDFSKPFSQIQRNLSAIPALAAKLKRKDWPHCSKFFETCFFDPLFDRRRLDPNGLAATAAYYSNQVAPQLRSYLTSLFALDVSFRSSLEKVRDRVRRARLDPDNAELRTTVLDRLQALEQLIRLPSRSTDLLQAVKDFEQRLTRDDGVELAYIEHRQGMLADRQSYYRTMKLPHMQSECSKQPPSEFCKLPFADDAPGDAIIELEIGSLQKLRAGNELINAVLPNLTSCATATSAAETELRGNLADALASKSYDETNKHLDGIERSWTWLTNQATLCNDARLWS
jgi:hypothetical protein